MDLSFPHYNGYHGDKGSDCRMSYPTFAAPTPINRGKTTTANTLTPGMSFYKNKLFSLDQLILA